MAAIAGKGGSIEVSGAQTMIKSWSINDAADALDVTSFDSSGIRQYVGGLRGWSGSFTANWTSENTAVPGGTAISFTGRLGSTTAGHLLKGNIIVTGIAYNCDVAGAISMDYSFQGTGNLNSSST
jgi:predicted secreted protein